MTLPIQSQIILCWQSYVVYFRMLSTTSDSNLLGSHQTSLVSLCVHVRVCVHGHMCVQMFMYTWVCAGERTNSTVIYWCYVPCFWGQGLSWLLITKFVKLAVQWAVGICLSLVLWCWVSKYESLQPTIKSMGSADSISDTPGCKASTVLTELLSQSSYLPVKNTSRYFQNLLGYEIAPLCRWKELLIQCS